MTLRSITLAAFFSLFINGSTNAQVLVDSIPYPDVDQGFWGIEVNADTIFLGDDFSGDIYFSDHDGNILGQMATGHGFDHGLLRTADRYFIAEDYATNGAHLYEHDLQGNLLFTWSFPDVIGGHSSGIGDLCADGNAVWYTMYYPDFDVYPYAYAYKWIPGDDTAIDTVPMLGEQPYGIALKGDTLFYVTDNLNDDPERIYAYDLTNEANIGFVELPDPDGDQSPRGLFFDGEFLYLIANRQGGSAFAYQTVYIYAFDEGVGMNELEPMDELLAYPNPARDHLTLVPAHAINYTLHDAQGRLVRDGSLNGPASIDVSALQAGIYTLTARNANGVPHVQRIAVE